MQMSERVPGGKEPVSDAICLLHAVEPKITVVIAVLSAVGLLTVPGR